MKRIILLVLFVFSYCVGSSQAISQRGTSAVTVQDARLFAQYNFRPPVFSDTIQANLQIGLDSCGALIFSRSINSYYLRACSPKRWVAVSGGGSGNSWEIGGNASPSSPNIGTTTVTEFNTITNGIARTKIKGSGIARSSAARNKYLMIDTTDKYLYYGDAGVTTDTTSLSNRINKKIDSLKRSNDSVYAFINGTRVFQFKDSLGTTPGLQQVLDVGNYAYNKQVYLYDSTNGGGSLTNYINFDLQRLGSDNYMDIIEGSGYRKARYSNQYARINSLTSGGGIGKSVLMGWNLGDNFMSLSFGDESFGGLHKLKSGSGFGSSFTTTIPPVTGTLAMSVNGNTADASGNITISTGGVAVDTIFRTLGKDSIFYKKNNITYSIKDSVGGSGTVTSVGLTMPSAFTVSNSPVTGSGTIGVTGSGTVSQYVRGDGTLANFPNSTGGGASVNYYLNGSVSQGTFGGVTYYQMSKTPILGAGTNFTRTNGAGNGYIASFITDAGDPSQLNIPGGNWNLEFYFQSSASGGSPQFYGEIYKVSATNVFTLIASGSANPEGITNGTTVDQYFTSLPVPQTTLLITDRLAIRIYVITGGRTLTLHTENGNLCEVLTTFTTGLTALNGLTEQVQNFATGTSGTDFGISSSSATHTFNLPTASATNRGALSTSDWSTFNGKLGASDTISLSNRINLKLNIADTSALQRKSIPAYSILANPTSVTANASAQAFRDTSGTYTGTITWTGTTAPSGATNHSYRLTQVGKCVTLYIALVYASNGSALTAVQMTLPTGAPTPVQPTGLTGSINNLYPMSVQLSTTTSVMANVIARNALRNNTSANGFELYSIFGSTGIAQCIVTVQYWTN